MGAPHSAERVQTVRRLAVEGLSDREIGGQLGLSKAAVEKIRRNHSIPPGKTIAVAPEVLNTIRLMASEGASDSEIGRAVGMSKAAVWGVRKRHDIQKADVHYASSRTNKKVIRPRQQHVHGTPSMYNSGCRCDDCRAANAERIRGLRARRRERLKTGEAEIEHGLSAYNNWGCRCEVCTLANSQACREYWRNGAERLKARGAAYREAHQERIKKMQQEWRDEHREHVRESNNQRLRDYQRETIDQAAKHYQEWTSAELEVISRTDISVKEMAFLLGRTWNAVQKQRQKMRDAERGKEPQARPSAVHTHGLGGYGRGCRCETCAEAKRQYRQGHEEKVKSATVPGARNARKEWTGPELEVAARDDLSVTEIARRLGRTYAAVSVIRHKIRHDPKTINFAGIAEGKPAQDDSESTDPPK